MNDRHWYCAACKRVWPPSVPLCPADGTLPRAEPVGSYLCVARISSSSTGEQLLAIHLKTGERFALKLLFPGVDLLPSFPSRPLVHEHLVCVREVGRRDDQVTYLVTDLIEGVPASRLVEEGPVGDAIVAEIGRQVASALGFLHRRGLVHGELTSDDISVTRQSDGQPHARVADVALRRLSAPGERRATPEDDEGTPAADVRALGDVLQTLMVKRSPVERARRASRSRPDGAPPLSALETLIRRCAAIDPSERPDAVALEKALAALVERLGGAHLPERLAPLFGLSATTAPALDSDGVPLRRGRLRPITGPVSNATLGPIATVEPRPIPDETKLAQRLTHAGAHPTDALAPAQLATSLRQAARLARELDGAVSAEGDLDVDTAGDLLRSLALCADQFGLWRQRLARR